MTKKEIKKELKNYGIYSLIHDLIVNKTLTSDELYRYESVIYSVLDNINENELTKAVKKASR